MIVERNKTIDSLRAVLEGFENRLEEFWQVLLLLLHERPGQIVSVRLRALQSSLCIENFEGILQSIDLLLVLSVKLLEVIGLDDLGFLRFSQLLLKALAFVH